MSILVNKNTKVICQGITGSAGAFHTKQCLEYGTKMVGGVTPGKGRQKDANGLPIFTTVHDPDAGINVSCAITEGIPVLDMIKAKAFLQSKPNVQLIGPTAPASSPPASARS